MSGSMNGGGVRREHAGRGRGHLPVEVVVVVVVVAVAVHELVVVVHVAVLAKNEYVGPPLVGANSSGSSALFATTRGARGGGSRPS